MRLEARLSRLQARAPAPPEAPRACVIGLTLRTPKEVGQALVEFERGVLEWGDEEATFTTPAEKQAALERLGKYPGLATIRPHPADVKAGLEKARADKSALAIVWPKRKPEGEQS